MVSLMRTIFIFFLIGFTNLSNSMEKYNEGEEVLAYGGKPAHHKIFDVTTADELAEKVAREILMVDEKNNDLTDIYKKIIQQSFQDPIVSNKPKKDVIILGAGIAGLLAGKILQRWGYNVTILEANGNRVGGRIKTFHHEEGKEPPFLDPNLYAEAGAMRIPSSHPLVNELIKQLELETQTFYNVDVKKDGSEEKLNHTWVCANGIQKRFFAYNDPSKDNPTDNPLDESPTTKPLPHERTLGFPIPERYKEQTAKQLLDAALNCLKEKIDNKPIEEKIEAWKGIILNFDKLSMLDFLRDSYPERVVWDYIGTIQNLTSRLFLSFMHSFVDTFYINPKERYVEIKGGNYNLPYKLAEKLNRKTIVMNARAVEIQWATSHEDTNKKAFHRKEPGVYVRTVGERVNEDSKLGGHSMDREFTADYLIVTVPFSSLRFIEVSPQFSYPKRRAITELHYDSATKVLLEFSERFWEWDKEEWRKWLPEKYCGHDSIGGGTVVDSANRFIYYPSHPPKDKNGLASNGGVILASYTWADEANRWDSILPDDRVTYALKGLTDIYGKGILRFFTGKCQTQSWMEDFYSFGEAAVFTPGQILGLYPNTSTIEGPIHFAGEHTSMKHAWIEGAIESAIRTAIEILERDK